MVKNKYLKQVESKLNNYFCYYKDPNILVISEDKSVLPFAYIIRDKNVPDYLLLSLAIDYPSCDKAVELALTASFVKKIALADKFYISKSGITYLGEDAQKYYDLDSCINLNHVDPLNKDMH